MAGPESSPVHKREDESCEPPLKKQRTMSPTQRTRTTQLSDDVISIRSDSSTEPLIYEARYRRHRKSQSQSRDKSAGYFARPAILGTDNRTEENTQVAQYKSLGGATVIIYVGESRIRFDVHEGHLSCFSGFFRGALRGDFRESEQSTVHLPYVKARTFDLFVQWIYKDHGGPPIEKAAERLSLRVDDSVRKLHFTECAKLYKLADFLECRDLMDDLHYIVSTSKNYYTVLPKADLVTYIYKNLDSLDQCFRDALLDRIVKGGAKLTRQTLDQAKEYPPEFWLHLYEKQRDAIQTAASERISLPQARLSSYPLSS